MNNKTVLFTARHGLLDPFISRTADLMTVFFFHPDIREPVRIGKATPITVTCRQLGLATLFAKLRLETLSPSYIKNFNKEIKDKNIDTIITLDFFRFLFIQALHYKKRHPEVRLFLYSETQRWPKNIISRLGMWIFWEFLKLNIKYVDKIFVFTKQGKVFFDSRLKGQVPVVLMPAPVNTEKFFPDASKVFMENGTLRILMNARFVAYKNHKDLLAALAKVKDRGLKFELTLIGRGGHKKDEVLEYAKDLGIEKQVHHIEAVPYEKMRDLYINHDVLVLPSYNEAIGMVVPEAMACGIPTITSDTVGANVYVEEGETGLVFKAGDAEALARSVLQIANPTVLRRLGFETRKKLEKYFTIQTLGNSLLEEIKHT